MFFDLLLLTDTDICLLWLSKPLCPGRHSIAGSSVYSQRPPVMTSMSYYFLRQWTHSLLTY